MAGLLLGLAFLLGSLPLTGWIFGWVTHQNLKQLGTGNQGVSAAFLHGGWRAGVPAVLAEIGRGLGTVALAQYLVPGEPQWMLGGLTTLAIGRFLSKGGGVTNVLWGLAIPFPLVVGAVLATGGGLWAITRQAPLSRRVGIGSLPGWMSFIGLDSLVFAALVLAVVLIVIDVLLKDDLSTVNLKDG